VFLASQLRLAVLSVVEFIGATSLAIVQIFYYLLKGKLDIREFVIQSSRLACNSWQAVFAVMVALGVVIGIQLAPEFATRGFGSEMGIIAAVSMLRELAPVIGALMIATQYGSGTAAEFANMKITEQVDALRVFKVSPVEFLILPRFMAAVIFFPALIWLSALIGIASTYVTSHIVEDIALNGFLNSIWTYLVVDDIYLCLFKSSVFGAMVIIIASVLGLRTRGGAKEVGRATTLTVILSFILIVLADFIITSIYL